ncbi:hypothetical protein D3C73_472230 [compost metagenome]
MEQSNTLAGDPVAAQQNGDFAQLLVSQHIVLAQNGYRLLAVDLQAVPDAVDTAAKQRIQRIQIFVLAHFTLRKEEQSGQHDSAGPA